MLLEQLFASLSFFLPAVRGSRRFFSRCPACPMVIFNFPSLSFMSVAFVETFSLPSVPYCCFSLFFSSLNKIPDFSHIMSFCSAVDSVTKNEQRRNVQKSQFIYQISAFLYSHHSLSSLKLHKYHTDTADNLTDKTIFSIRTDHLYPKPYIR